MTGREPGSGGPERRHGALRPSDRWTVGAIALIALLATALHAWWIVRHRTGTGLSTDEGRLLLEAVPYQSWHPVTVLRQWRAPGEIAPLALALAGPLLGSGAQLAFAPLTLLPWSALLVAATGDLGRRLGGRWAGVLAAALVATVPAAVWWTRVFELIVPGAALWTLTLSLLVASDRLRRHRWAVASGVAFGVGLISRSMLIGFVPVLLVLIAACVLTTWRSWRDAVTRVARFAVPAAAVAATWWLLHLADAIGYLTGTSSDLGAGRSLRDRMGKEWYGLERITTGTTWWLAATALVALTAVAVHAATLAVPRWRGRRTGHWRGAATLALSTAGLVSGLVDGWTVWAVAAMAGAALAVLAAVAQGGVAIAAWSSPRALAAGAALGTFTTLVATGVGFEGFQLVTISVAIALLASLVGVAWLRWTAVPLVVVLALQASAFLRADAGWYQQQLLQEGGTVPSDRPLPPDQRRWMDATIRADRWADRHNDADEPPVVVVTNDLFFAGAQLGALNRSVGGRRAYLTMDGARLPLDPAQREVFDDALLGISADPPNEVRAQAARDGEGVLRSLGFRPVRQLPLPDGRRATLWSR